MPESRARFRLLSVNKNPIALLLAASLFAGCAVTGPVGFEQPSRAPKSTIDVFYLDEAPSKKHTEIAALSFRGSRADQSKASRYFIKEAKRLGADGVLIFVPGYDYLKAGRLGLEPDMVFRASAFVYNPN